MQDRSAALAGWKKPGQPVKLLAPGKPHGFDTAEESRFMLEVFEAQRTFALKRMHKEFFPGLPEDELATVEGKHRLRKDAAANCRALLKAARDELQRLQTAQDAAALQVKAIGMASSYRDPTHDLRAWEKVFIKVFHKTRADRAALSDGELGPNAVTLMVKRLVPIKAVPGFSNHTKGTAVDFSTTDKGADLGPSTSQSAQWREAWFYKWLRQHGGEHRFKQLATEEWHWDYQG